MHKMRASCVCMCGLLTFKITYRVTWAVRAALCSHGNRCLASKIVNKPLEIRSVAVGSRSTAHRFPSTRTHTAAAAIPPQTFCVRKYFSVLIKI